VNLRPQKVNPCGLIAVMVYVTYRHLKIILESAMQYFLWNLHIMTWMSKWRTCVNSSGSSSVSVIHNKIAW